MTQKNPIQSDLCPQIKSLNIFRVLVFVSILNDSFSKMTISQLPVKEFKWSKVHFVEDKIAF